ncbi:hypothetical protein KAI87_07210 [Myxococcota bacterium]|nr:hypothetical protein [Myxococcota bacterium]
MHQFSIKVKTTLPRQFVLFGLIALSLWGCGDKDLTGTEGHACIEANLLCTGIYGLCDDGLWCNSDRICVQADAPRPEGEYCTSDEVCEGDLICGSNPFVCRRSCTEFFATESECLSDEICKASLDLDGNWVGACIPSWCDTDENCESGEACIKATASAGYCLAGCEISWVEGSYNDNCGNQSNQIFYCQPLGDAKEALVCLDTSYDAAEPDEACSPIKNPCKKGLACINEFCRAYCDSAAPACDEEESCVEQSVGNDVIYFCR